MFFNKTLEKRVVRMRSQYCRLIAQETSFIYVEFEVIIVQTYKDGHWTAGYLILEKRTRSELKT